MFGRNQLGCQDQRCACGQINGEGGGEITKSLRNGRIVRRTGVDIAEIRRRSESDLRSRREEAGMPVRITNGWTGDDLMQIANQGDPREEYARG